MVQLPDQSVVAPGDCQWGFSPVAINTLPDGRMAQALGGMVLEQGERRWTRR